MLLNNNYDEVVMLVPQQLHIHNSQPSYTTRYTDVRRADYIFVVETWFHPKQSEGHGQKSGQRFTSLICVANRGGTNLKEAINQADEFCRSRKKNMEKTDPKTEVTWNISQVQHVTPGEILALRAPGQLFKSTSPLEKEFLQVEVKNQTQDI